MDVAIIGAGIAGLSCAERLVAAGHGIVLYDKARGPGGRMSTRRVEAPAGMYRFDHGAQYFTARDPDFERLVLAWQAEGVVDRWPAAGPDAWVGVPGMNAPVRALAARHRVIWSRRIANLARDGSDWMLTDEAGERMRHEAVVIAVPAEQCVSLVADLDPVLAGLAGAIRSDPCWTAMIAFPERLPVTEDCLREQGAIGWAARDGAKPGRGGETWVIQGAPDWSRRHLEEDAAQVVARLVAALGDAIGAALPDPLHASAHRWRYARTETGGTGPYWNGALALGACGDWTIGPRVELAWLSGRRLGDRIMAG